MLYNGVTNAENFELIQTFTKNEAQINLYKRIALD
jgi:hypothetical protein